MDALAWAMILGVIALFGGISVFQGTSGWLRKRFGGQGEEVEETPDMVV